MNKVIIGNARNQWTGLWTVRHWDIKVGGKVIGQVSKRVDDKRSYRYTVELDDAIFRTWVSADVLGWTNIQTFRTLADARKRIARRIEETNQGVK